MNLTSFAEGLAATVVAAFMFGSWIAIGTYIVRGVSDDDEAFVPIAVLAASAVTAFVLALCSLVGWIAESVVITSVVYAGALATRLKRVWHIIVGNVDAFRLVQPRVLRIIALAAGIIMWISAVAPPRSADAMRYHLAHIKLIIEDGKWMRIADFHFALPFGWTLSYLPFELLHIPHGAQLLSVALGLFMMGALIPLIVREGEGSVAIGAVILMFLHPFVVRTFTEAGTDPYAIFAVGTTTILLVRVQHITGSQATLFGFVAWIGVQSRYQAVAVGLAASLAFLFAIRGRTDRLLLTSRATAGAVGAIALASPFYLANLKWFGNPVWPLLIPRPDDTSAFSDIVARNYAKSLTGRHGVAETIGGVVHLLTWPRLFPLAIVIVASLIAARFSVSRKARAASVFGLVFLVLWALMQPRLYPKFVLFVLPVAAISAGLAIGRHEGRYARVRKLINLTAAVFLAVTIGLSSDSLRYFVRGEDATFHRTTWFYPAFEWINSRTPPGSRTLAILSSGMTYYLNRPYRRGDPWIGGEIDWLTIHDGQLLAHELVRRRYRYVLYEDRDWSMYKGGTEMQRAITDAIAAGALLPLETFDLRLYTSRARGTFNDTRVRVLQVRSSL